MACKNMSLNLQKEAETHAKMWEESKAIEAYGMDQDTAMFDKLFDTVTGKPHEYGIGLTEGDYKKMQVAIKDLDKSLKDPGLLSNKIFQHIFVGKSVAKKNPIVKDFFDAVTRANEYRNSDTAPMMNGFDGMISELKLAILEFNGVDTTETLFTKKGNLQASNVFTPKIAGNKVAANNLFKKLERLENAYLAAGENRSTSQEFKNLWEFINDPQNESRVFQDFIIAVEQGIKPIERDFYMKDKRGNIIKDPTKRAYLRRIETAVQSWKDVQVKSKGHLVNSINTLNQTINIVWGGSKSAKRLIEKYTEIRKNLEKFEGNYLPHYILDVLGDTIHMADKISKLKSSGTDYVESTSADKVFGEFIDKADAINTRLSNRLKYKKKKGKSEEYFSRNPLMYAQKYIQQVLQFNQSTYIDNAYAKGLSKLSEAILKGKGTDVEASAKIYRDILSDMYGTATRKNRVDMDPTSSNILRMITSLQFTSKLGFSLRGAIKNGTQRLLNFVYFGSLMQMDAMKALKNDDYANEVEIRLNKHGLRFADVSMVTEGAVTNTDLIANGIKMEKAGEEGLNFTRMDQTIIERIAGATEKFAGKSSIFTRYFENKNRESTFKVAFHKRAEQLKITDKYAGWRDSTKLKDDMYDKAGRYAAKMTTLLHFDYQAHAKARMLTGPIGQVLGQFQHYAMSFAQLQFEMVRDLSRATKAGKFAGPELGRIVRLFALYSITELMSGIANLDFGRYVNNDTLEKAQNFSMLFSEEEDVRKEAFYGKGLVGATGIVPLSDVVELHNLGAAAGYWDLLADEDSTAGWLMGMRDYDKLDTGEFAQELAGLTFIQGERGVRSLGLWRDHGFMAAVRSELGLYPGEEVFGVKTREFRKNVGLKPPKTARELFLETAPSHLKGGYGAAAKRKFRKNRTGIYRSLSDAQRASAVEALKGLG